MTACSSEKLSQKVHLSTCDLCQRFECRRCFPKHVLIGAIYDFRFRFFLSSLLINQSAEGAGVSYVIKYWIRNYYRKNKWPSVNAILTEVTRSCVREGEHVAEHVTVEQCGGCRSYLTKVFQRWRLSPWGGGVIRNDTTADITSSCQSAHRRASDQCCWVSSNNSSLSFHWSHPSIHPSFSDSPSTCGLGSYPLQLL